MLRPTKNVPMSQLPPQHQCRVHVEVNDDSVCKMDMDDWVTKSKWLHWDHEPVSMGERDHASLYIF
jgi:hypothetical protein